ncbi:phage tail tape measure protein [Clostridium sp. WILCCON 0269]|uniref:Phage tail tape measure protein n=1 Tax=Candidatus Clostridium eludens TaxID=3381663 RepID=A0ABW8ST20_9CLOT
MSSLQELTYEINYNVDDSGLAKSLGIVDNFGTSLGSVIGNIEDKIGTLPNVFEKINPPISQLNEVVSSLNVDNLSNSLKSAMGNTSELNASIERQQRLTELVNNYADEYNAKIDERLGLQDQLNGRTTTMSSSIQDLISQQQKLNEEIFGTVDNEEKFANEANQAADNVTKTTTKTNELKDSLSSINKVSSGIGSILGAFGFIGVGYGIAAGIKDAITSYSEFQQEMATVHATLGQVTNKDMTDLSNKAIQLSNAFGLSSLEVSQGEEELASHGLTTKQILDTIQPSMLLAVAGNIQMKDATLDISAALRNFNLDMSQATHVANVYAATAADTAASLPDMAQALKNVSPVAGEVGISLENTVAAIGALADKGIMGSQAGTDLKIMIERLIAPVGKGAELIHELGFSAIDPTTHKMKDFGSIVRDLSSAFESHGLTTAPEKNSALSIIFGKEALPGTAAIFGTAPKQIDDLTNSLKNSNNAAQNMVITMNDTLAGAFRKLKSNVENAFITNIDKTELGYSLKEFVVSVNKNMPAVSSEIGKVLDTAIRFGGGIKQNWGSISSTILGIASAFAVLKTASAATEIIKTLGSLGKFSGPVLGIAAAASLASRGFLALKQGNTGLGALLLGTAAGVSAISVMGGKGILTGGVIGIAAEGFVELKKGNTGLGALLIGTATGIKAIQLAMKLGAGPVGIIVALAISGLAAGASYLIEKYGSLGKAWDAVWGGIKNTTKAVIDDIERWWKELENFFAHPISGTIKLFTPSNTGKGTTIDNVNWKTGIPMKAAGDNNFAGGSVIVGERGPELVNLPGGSQIIPAPQTAQMLSTSYAQMGSGTLNTGTQLNNSTKKVIADNQKLITDYVNQHILYGQNSVKNFSAALLGNEALTTTATTKVSTDNKNIMYTLSQSGLTYGTGMVNNLTQGVQASEGNLTSVVQTLTNKVIDTFRSGFGIHSPSTVMYSMGTNLLQGLVNGMTSKDMGNFVQSWIGSMTSAASGSMGGAVSGNLVSWLTTAMALTGTPMAYLPALEQIAMHESGGDPKSINLWDINAKEGHPSKGLMQLIDDNMRYALPGMNDIWNPIDNAVAAIRYMNATYGSIANVPGVRALARGGSYVGYAGGTSNATPGVHLVGEKGPELVWMKGGESVTPNNQINVAPQTPYNATNNRITVQSNPVFQININGAGKNSQDIATEVDNMLRKKFKNYLDDTMATVKIQMGLS